MSSNSLTPVHHTGSYWNSFSSAFSKLDGRVVTAAAGALVLVGLIWYYLRSRSEEGLKGETENNKGAHEPQNKAQTNSSSKDIPSVEEDPIPHIEHRPFKDEGFISKFQAAADSGKAFIQNKLQKAFKYAQQFLEKESKRQRVVTVYEGDLGTEVPVTYRVITNKSYESQEDHDFELDCLTNNATVEYENKPIPNVSAEVRFVEVGGYKVGAASCKGRRSGKIEDTDYAGEIRFSLGGQQYRGSLFAVFDGHGGSECAEFLRDNFAIYLREQLGKIKGAPTDEEIYCSLRECILQLDADYTINRVGSTATGVFILNCTAWAFNVGDSRTALWTGEHYVGLSQDADIEMDKGQLVKEGRFNKKVHKLGGKIGSVGFGGQLGALGQLVQGEVDGSYVSKGVTGVATLGAIGDLAVVAFDANSLNKGGYKLLSDRDVPFEGAMLAELPCCIPPQPQIVKYDLSGVIKGESFVFIGCDGIFDVMTTQQALGLVNRLKSEGKNEQEIAEIVVRTAINSGSKDNCSAMVVFL